MDAHLRRCANCRQVLEQERQMAVQLRSLMERPAVKLALHPDVRRQVMTTCQSSPPQTIQMWQRPAWWLAAAAGVIVAIGSGVHWHLKSPAIPLESSIYIKCVKTEYADATHQQWVSRTLTVLKKNGTESYARITVTKIDASKKLTS